jgi:hypothetical protein
MDFLKIHSSDQRKHVNLPKSEMRRVQPTSDEPKSKTDDIDPRVAAIISDISKRITRIDNSANRQLDRAGSFDSSLSNPNSWSHKKVDELVTSHYKRNYTTISNHMDPIVRQVLENLDHKLSEVESKALRTVAAALTVDEGIRSKDLDSGRQDEYDAHWNWRHRMLCELTKTTVNRPRDIDPGLGLVFVEMTKRLDEAENTVSKAELILQKLDESFRRPSGMEGRINRY